MSDRFVFITDTHFRSQTPRCRSDEFFETMLRKLQFVIDFCKKKKVKNLLHGGDLFDTPYVTSYVAGTVAKMLKKSGLQVYYILGNHDITGKNPDTYINSKIHMFESYPWFHMIGGKYIEFDECYLTGFDFTYDTECPESIDVETKDKPVVCLFHGMIDDKPKYVHEKTVVVDCKNIRTNAELVFTGHYHLGYHVVKHGLLPYFCNPGSMARMSATEFKQGLGPGLMYAVLKNRSVTIIKRYHIPVETGIYLGTDDTTAKDERDSFEIAFRNMIEEGYGEGDLVELLSAIKNNKELIKTKSDKRAIKKCRLKLEELRNERSS